MTVHIDGTTGVDVVQDSTITSAKVVDGTLMPVDLAQKLTVSTVQTTTSGTSKDFTSIPSWVQRITVMFNGVSTNGSSIPIIQIGHTSPETTGYIGSAGINGGATLANYSTGILIGSAMASTYVLNGAVTLTLFDSAANAWAIAGSLGRNDTTAVHNTGGVKVLSGVLDIVRLTTVNGTDTFDAGAVNIMWE